MRSDRVAVQYQGKGGRLFPLTSRPINQAHVEFLEKDDEYLFLLMNLMGKM